MAAEAIRARASFQLPGCKYANGILCAVSGRQEVCTPFSNSFCEKGIGLEAEKQDPHFDSSAEAPQPTPTQPSQ